MVNPNQSSADQEDEFDLVNLIDVFVDSRWLIAIICIIMMCAGIAYALLTKPIYESDIMIQVEDSPDSAAAKGILGDVSSLFSEKSSTAGEIQILTSRLVVAQAVDDLHLFIDASPVRLPLIGNFLARFNKGLSNPGIFSAADGNTIGPGFTWGSEAIDVTAFNVPEILETEKFQLTYKGDGTYVLNGKHLTLPSNGKVGVLSHFDSDSGPIELMVSGISAKAGATFNVARLSRLKTIQELQKNLVAVEKVKESGVIIASLQGPNPDDIAKVLGEISGKYLQQNVERKAAEAAQSLQFLNAQLPVLKGRLEAAEDRYTQMQNRTGAIALDEQAKVALQQAADAKSRSLQLMQQRADLITRFNSSHPAIIALDQQIAALQSYEDKFNQQMKSMPDVQQESARLLLDVKVNGDLYSGLLNNAQQLELVRAGKVGTVRIIDQAVVPEDPIKPVKGLVILGFTVAGFILGSAIAFLRNLLFKGVTDPAEIEKHLGLSVYATIPLSERQEVLTGQLKSLNGKLSVLTADSPNDPAIESLRSFRTALQFAMLNARNNIVLITGPAPGVGKSFISVNVAAVLASGGKRVLLIDADMRKGHTNRYFGISRDNGLSDVILGQISASNVIKKEILPNLDLIVTGKLPPNPAELLLGARIKNLLDEVGPNYDTIIIDSPPVLAAADTGILAAHVGTVFLVAYSGATRVGELAECVKRLDQAGSHANGVLFNGLNPTLGRYGYGSKYGSYRYQNYRYGDGFDE